VNDGLRIGPRFTPKWYSIAQVAQMLGSALA
jgi:hypothetical protein